MPPLHDQLATLLDECEDSDHSKLILGRANREDLLGKVRKAESNQGSSFYDEQVWTLLVAAGYAMGKSEGVKAFYEQLNQAPSEPAHIWFEALPLPPRSQEGNTNLDLAIGAITHRGNTVSGIRYAPHQGNSVNFIEAKWLSDISHSTTHDHHRNQLARVIDSALAFHDNTKPKHQRQQPEQVTVTLLTPRVFKQRTSSSRFYAYKFDEYTSGRNPGGIDEAAIIADLGDASEKADPLDYQDIDLVQKLRLQWITYEQLIDNMPESRYKEALMDFSKCCGKVLNL
ncbi:MAG: hypothetical protein ACQETE_09785 [Bacteroidota bacterium]